MACAKHDTLILILTIQLGELLPDSVLMQNSYFLAAIDPSDNLFFPIPLEITGNIFNIGVNLIRVPFLLLERGHPSEHGDIILALSSFMNDFRFLFECLHS
jgi:hypothetical protein